MGHVINRTSERMNIDEWESTKDDAESRRSEVVVCLTRHVVVHWEMAVSCVGIYSIHDNEVVQLHTNVEIRFLVGKGS